MSRLRSPSLNLYDPCSYITLIAVHVHQHGQETNLQRSMRAWTKSFFLVVVLASAAWPASSTGSCEEPSAPLAFNNATPVSHSFPNSDLPHAALLEIDCGI